MQRSIEAEAAREQAAKAAIQLRTDRATARTLALETEVAEQRRLVLEAARKRKNITSTNGSYNRAIQTANENVQIKQQTQKKQQKP